MNTTNTQQLPSIEEFKQQAKELKKSQNAYAGTIRTASRFTSGHSAGVDSDS